MWESILSFKKMILKIQKSNLNMLTMTYINAQLNLLVDINIIMV
jgi:hypothetical protein